MKTPENFNLLDKEWIPVFYRDGAVKRIGIRRTLKDAGEICCITLASPLDLFAIHRFLLTLLYWKADLAGGVEKVRESLLEGIMPSQVINSIKQEACCFDLFNNKSPFLQDPSAARDKKKKIKSVGSLFAECATGTNIAHFHHGDDKHMRLCLPCAAVGMLRVVPWAQGGGRGLTPSVHKAPPIMAIAIGDNLAITLGLNLVLLDVKAGEAKWSGHFKPTDLTKSISYLEAFTWNPRRICLPAPQEGNCWNCGQSGVPTVGEIVYMENENTKLIKKGNKSIPFSWHDPSAFYPDNEYTTVRSYSEVSAMDNKDLTLLLAKDTGKKKRERPQSIVVEKNVDHEGWLLIVSSTDGKAKTFDHRQLELTKLSPETIRALLPAAPQSSIKGLDGWKEPVITHPANGMKRFVQAAVRLLTYNDWAVLSNAAYRSMHDSPAAFDVFSGLYWGLRGKVRGLPSRNVIWLMLKLLAAVPARIRTINPNAKFCPLQSLPKRQLNECGKSSPYPISFPLGSRLEAALRGVLDSNIRKRHPESVDWIGLCYGLNQILD